MTVTLQNRSPRQRVFHLDHPGASFLRRVAVVREHDPKSGKKTPRAFAARIPDTLTLNAFRSEGDSISGLPDEVLRAPEIRKAIKRQAIVWSKDKGKVHPPGAQAKIAAQKAAAAQAAANQAAAANAAPPVETKPEEVPEKAPEPLLQLDEPHATLAETPAHAEKEQA